MSAKKTVLLVDDDNEIIESMRTVLESKGYRVIIARDGNAGLTVAEHENPDLVILDMMMPKKSGFLVLEKLKGRPGGLIPTIMITGNEGSRHRAYAECSRDPAPGSAPSATALHLPRTLQNSCRGLPDHPFRQADPLLRSCSRLASGRGLRRG
jgi:CheY-like chemotaxis protein